MPKTAKQIDAEILTDEERSNIESAEDDAEREQAAGERNDRADNWAAGHRYLHEKGFNEETAAKALAHDEGLAREARNYTLQDKTRELSSEIEKYTRYLLRTDTDVFGAISLHVILNQLYMLAMVVEDLTRDE